MSGANELDKLTFFQKPERSILRDISPGAHLRLRENTCRQLREREWVFNRTENDLVFLIHENGSYGLVVGIEDIDWNEFKMNSVKNN